MTELTARELLIMLYQTAVDAVDGRYLVNQWCQQQLPENRDFTHCVAIGKAAAAMLEGVLDQLPSVKHSLLICPSIKITRKLKKNRSINCIASSHPVPDEKSIQAGRALVEFLSSTGEKDKVLFLISGGTSALVEFPVDNISLQDLQQINRHLLSSGKDIHQVNSWRQRFSQIKGGGLLRYLKSNCTQLIISDVKDDLPQFIGSGLLVCNDSAIDDDHYLSSFPAREPVRENNVGVETNIIGNLNIAMQAVHKVAKAESLESFLHKEFIEGDVADAAEYLYSRLQDAPNGIHIWGGETTVNLPDNPGIGGRNQALALNFAQLIERTPDLHLLCAGTDGVDGNSSCAGAVVSSYTCQKAEKMGFDVQQELEKANSGLLLMATDDLVMAESSNTNVMDIIIAYKN